MIHWLFQSLSSHPDLEQGIPPSQLLNALELDWFEALKTEKRRKDYLLERWTAKHLLQTMLQGEDSVEVPLHELTIYNDANGAPYVTWHSGGEARYLPISLSISRLDRYAFCAVAPLLSPVFAEAGYNALHGLPRTWAVGVNLETIQPHCAGFADGYFTDAEAELLAGMPPNDKRHDLLVAATWSAKGAIDRALHLNATIDTRAVSCLIETQAPPETWTPFEIHWEAHRLNTPPETLLGWWQTIGRCVLTLVVSCANFNTHPSHAGPGELSQLTSQMRAYQPGLVASEHPVTRRQHTNNALNARSR